MITVCGSPGSSSKSNTGTSAAGYSFRAEQGEELGVVVAAHSRVGAVDARAVKHVLPLFHAVLGCHDVLEQVENDALHRCLRVRRSRRDIDATAPRLETL